MISLIQKNINSIVGAVFFSSMILIGYLTIVKKNITEVKEPLYIPVILESAESLKIGTNVTLLGVPIGILGSLHYILLDVRGKAVVLDKNRSGLLKRNRPLGMVRGQFVVAVLDLTGDVRMYPDYSIVTQYPSLFSLKTIDIRPGKKHKGENLLKIKFLSKEEVFNLRTKQKIPHFGREDVVLHAENFGDPLFLLTEIISENQTQILRITQNLAEITDKINKGKGNLSALLNKRGLERDAVELLIQVSVLAEELGEGLEAYRETNSLIDSLKTLFFILLSGL